VKDLSESMSHTKLLAGIEFLPLGAGNEPLQGIQEGIQEKLARLERTRLAKERAKLDAAAEQALADEWSSNTLREWPEY